MSNFGGVSAEDVMLASQKIAAAVQLSMAIAAIYKHQETAGSQTLVQVQDQHKPGVFVNSQILLPPLEDQMQTLVAELEDSGISMRDILRATEERFNQHYK